MIVLPEICNSPFSKHYIEILELQIMTIEIKDSIGVIEDQI